MDVTSERTTNIVRLVACVGMMMLAVCVGGCPKDTGQTPDETSANEGAGEPLRAFVWQREEMPLDSGGQQGHRAVRLNEGGVVMAGGRGRMGSWSRKASYYDSETGEWEALPALNRARAGSEIVGLSDDRVMMIGGISVRHAQLKSSEMLDAERGSWTETPALPVNAFRHAAAKLPGGDVLVVTPGSESDSRESGVYRFDPDDGTWSEAARFGDMVLHPGLIGTETGAMLVGGKQPPADKKSPNPMEFEPTDQTFIYNASDDAWRTGPAMNRARGRPVLRRVDANRVLVTSFRMLDQPAEVFNAEAKRWREVGAPDEARTWSPRHSELPSGPIVQTDTRTLAVYRGATGESDTESTGWIELPKLPEPRLRPSITRLADGTVLVAAGVDRNEGSYQSSLRVRSEPVVDGGVSLGTATSSAAMFDARQRAERAAKQLLLGRQELQTIADEAMDFLKASELQERWSQRSDGQRPVVSMRPMRNKTGLPIGGTLSALVSRLEVALVNEHPVTVMANRSTRRALRRERQRQRASDEYGSGSDDGGASVGGESQVDYVVTGEVMRDDSPQDQDLTVSYRIVLKVIEGGTDKVVHQRAVTLETSASVD